MTGLQIRSLIKASGELELFLAPAPARELGANEVLVRVEAAPVNPSDLLMLLGPADMRSAQAAGTPDQPRVTATVPAGALPMVKARLDVPLAVGNEGAGVVVAAGASAAAQALLGRRVAVLAESGTYAQYCGVSVDQCLPLPEGATAAQGASAFVNPLTVLGMVETMKREGHRALVQTAAASNLGQMLVRVCQKDGIPLVNIVRSQEQAALLQGLGAQYVCNSQSPHFEAELTDALAATGATLGFDAIGGGRLVGQIFSCMETAINRNAKVYSRYGSTTHKQIYIYGGLDNAPTEIVRNFGVHWGLGGWLMHVNLQKMPPAEVQALKARVAAELTTTFQSHYAGELSLAEVLQLDKIAQYAARATGSKFLVVPQKGLA
jgi:NADPH2:quinone reductase